MSMRQANIIPKSADVALIMRDKGIIHAFVDLQPT
jgi:hypothetical protein